jgi:hypothetical protein
MEKVITKKMKLSDYDILNTLGTGLYLFNL